MFNSDEGDINHNEKYLTLRGNASTIPALQDRFCVHDLKQKHVNATNIDIFVLGCATLPDTLMTCILASDIELFLAMDLVVQDYGANAKDPMFPFVNPHLPFESELCVGLVRGIWCRCMFIERIGNSKEALVYAFDYGIITSIDVDDILVNKKKAEETHILLIFGVLFFIHSKCADQLWIGRWSH